MAVATYYSMRKAVSRYWSLLPALLCSTTMTVYDLLQQERGGFEPHGQIFGRRTSSVYR